MEDRIYKLTGDSELEELEQCCFVAEAELQVLIAKHPKLIMQDPKTQKFLLVDRELGIPITYDGANKYSLDHLFIDENGVPVLVEVKRSNNPEVRRSVVGQMLDYAANASIYWTIDSLKDAINKRLMSGNLDYDNVIENHIGDNLTESEFWAQVKSNLRSGNLKLVFASDELPSELITIINFLSENMDTVDVYGVQICRHRDVVLSKIISSSIRTQRAEINKKYWDKISFLEELVERNNSRYREVTTKLLDKMLKIGYKDIYGQGLRSGSCRPTVAAGDINYNPITLWTYGKIEIQFEYIRKNPAFETEADRMEFVRELNKIGIISLDESVINRRPSFDILELQDQSRFDAFIGAMEWFTKKVQSYHESD
ncbi:MAG TPA: hypothetical protein PKV16_04495 [Caldisericia bacterium]|nr:hypothetical protein [Caldisericia bacterium]HPF48569.1 hypothetical protein [Caldisericia bacterium]HPI83771.1 hypothetical protein [Caldisericia bacterium]HPQ93024.1 hypothetical protein [Caldisericia bacterium]HRV75143.1 hypothetical protein [Caldisericia bacterium]